jgi:hypothetical protein
MTNEQPLTPELESGNVPFGARLRSILAVPARLIGVLIIPDRVMPPLVKDRRAWAPFFAILCCCLASAYIIGSRIDVASKVLQEEAMMQKNMGADYELKSDREINENIVKGRTIEQVKLGLVAGLGQPAIVFLLAVATFLLGRFVGGRTTFSGSVTVAAAARLPIAVKALVVAIMALPSKTLTPADIDALQNVALLHLPGKLSAVTFDAFGLWSAVLFAFGLAAAGQISRRRAFITIMLGYVVVLFIGVGVAGMMGGMPPGGAR